MMRDEFYNLVKKQQIRFNIISLITIKPRTIAELSRELKINRSTLRYYLYSLQSENKVIFKREEKEPGRPTYIKLNEETLNKENLEQKKILEDYREEMNKSELVHFLRKLFKGKEFLTLEQIISKVEESKIKVEEPKFSKILSALNFIKLHFKEVEDGWKGV